MISFKPPCIPQPCDINNKPAIFLAGSIENGKAADWQTELTLFLNEYDVVIYNPRRDDWDVSWQQNTGDSNFVQQVHWEINHILAADLVVFYIQGGTLSPITLYELGLVSKDGAAKNKDVIVFCEDGFWRKGNVDVVCNMFNMAAVKTFDELKNGITRWINTKLTGN